jgi:Transposase and inactivated derivatives
MENTANWRTESHTVYFNDFKLRIVELASQADANVARSARENGVAHNLIFKWLRMWHNGRGGYHVACLQPSPCFQHDDGQWKLFHL